MLKPEIDSDLITEYLGISGRSIVIFLAVSVATVAVVTCLYSAIFGFDTWKNDMTQAGSLMLSKYDAPPTDPRGGNPADPGVAPAAATGGCQFLCPSCGVVDLPMWNTTGDPMCPNCGSWLSVKGGGSATQLAAVG